MTKGEKQKATRNPLAQPGRPAELDPAVRTTLKQAAIKRGDKIKVTFWLKVELYERVRRLALAEAGSKKALSDAATVLLEQGLADYDAGKLKIKATPVVIERKTLARG
jgi:hypothetical protein